MQKSSGIRKNPSPRTAACSAAAPSLHRWISASVSSRDSAVTRSRYNAPMPTYGLVIEYTALLGRIVARFAVGEGFPFPLFRLRGGVTVSPWRTVGIEIERAPL